MPNFDSDNQNASKQYVPAASFDSFVRRINIQKRYVLAIFTSIGFTLIFAIRSNLCTFLLEFEFDHNIAQARGYSELYFMGAYCLVQIPAAILVNRFSPFKVFGLSILCSVLLGLGTPIIIKLFHATWLVYVGFLHGIFQGAAFPAAQGMWQFWVPPIGRSTIISIAYSGCFFGVAIGAKFSDLVCNLLPQDNILIVYGVLGIVWFILWTWSIYESPSAHPTITDAELQYLKQSIENQNLRNNSPSSIPWKQVLFAKPVIALYAVNFCRAWTSMYLLQGDFTDFDFIHLTNVFFVEYSAGLIAISLPIVGFLADLLLTKTSKSVSHIRRLYISGGLFSLLLLYVPGIFVMHHVGPLFLSIIFSCVMYSCIICGFFVNHVDIAPKYAHATMAVSNMVNVLSSNFIFWVPITLPFEPQEDTTGYAYQNMEDYFIVATFFHIVGALTYFVWGSGIIERWSKREEEPEDNRAISFANNAVGI